jgi:hypothetical protein
MVKSLFTIRVDCIVLDDFFIAPNRRCHASYREAGAFKPTFAGSLRLRATTRQPDRGGGYSEPF